ncbi:thioredoxin protein disulfide isomerase [Cryptosporidium ubiquitum]|uniref:Thioredoxin protein disulfide isomerase n=1 Tax=Cryptosporidium ubiquitum TaxID=857276 RepID=A0A1J4MIX3_9CRYT|nr:thioredoxin protein disulfide isomerase [Cryptosporidium ubiquitum]OII72980.1 thioredoxin protein disulfide isomerase [Cryptosporidium ubiquitum]
MELYSIFLLFLFSLILKVYAENQDYPKSENLINLKDHEFKEKVLDNLTDQIWFVKFYAPWCGHCRHLYPEILKVSEHYKDNDKIKIAKVDCSVEKKICKEQNVNGYPTMRIFSRGKFIKQYKRARRTHMDIIQFIERGIQPDIVKINSPDQINQISHDLSEYPILLMMFNSEIEIEQNLEFFEEIIKRNDFELTIAVTYNQSVKSNVLESTKDHKFSTTDLCSTSPCITIIGKDNFSPTILLVKEAEFVFRFMQQYRFPFLSAPSRMEFIEYLNSGNLVVIMGIQKNVEVNNEISGDFITDFGLIAEKVRRELFLPIKFSTSEIPRGILFAIVDFVSYSSLFREFGITEFNFIQGYEIVVADGLKYYYNRQDMMKIPVLFETIELISNQNPKVPRLKAYSFFNPNTIRRFFYDLNVIISDIFYKSWVHAVLVTITAFLIVAGLTVFCCLIFFGDLADSYLLHDDMVVTEMQKMAPKAENKIHKNKDEKSENELDNSSLSDTVRFSDEEPELVESKKER